ncbi:MAG: serine/threonine protein kinase [Roseibium sp.]|nr:serine/threonine protein kinase [Roseibium sp.]
MRIFGFIVFFVVLGWLAPAEARIYCPLPEDGIWINPDATAKEITRIEIETTCIDEQVQARMRAFTKCIPRDCKWGWTPAELRDGGGFRVLLVGFLSSKELRVRAFRDVLDVQMLETPHDPARPDKREVYNLQRR